MKTLLQSKWVKPLLFLAALVPLAAFILAAIQDRLSPNPIEDLTHMTGDWALRLLLITLALTPLRRLTGCIAWMRFRRMLGLFAFFYASLHLLTYFVLDLGLYWEDLGEDILKRPYITVGFTAWLLLVPLALTSTKGMMRRLGRRWKQLHRLVYVIGALGVVHYLWLVKADLREPLVYAGVLAVVLGIRVWYAAPTRGGSRIFAGPRSSI